MNGQQLIVLADDTGHRAVPLWLRVDGSKLLRALDRPAGDAVMAGVLEETAARLLHAAGMAVIAVDIEPASEDVPELRSDTAAARVELATAAGARHVLVSAEYGLKLAVAAGAPVRVADAVIDRLAVPVQGEDVLAPFLLPAAAGRRAVPGSGGVSSRGTWRSPTAWTGGSWLAASWRPAGRIRRTIPAPPQTGPRCWPPRSRNPPGSAVLFQEILAEDHLGRTVTFRGQLRTTSVAGQAGLHLAAGRPVEPPAAHLRDRGGSSLTGPGRSDWTWHEVTMPVPGDAGIIRFGISLTGRGRVELRNAELSPARPQAAE